MSTDQYGLPLTATSQEAVDAFDATLTEYLLFGRDTGARLKETFAADSDMPMAHCLKGYFFQLFANPVLDAKADQALGAAVEAAKSRAATDREAGHLAALADWRKGDLDGATRCWEAVLLDHPRDMLALKLGHYTHFYLGRPRELRDSVARVMPAWDETVPGYGFVCSMCAFGLEEAGDYAAAEAWGRRGVEINPADIWGVHAVAHVMEMQGRHREGIDWIAGLEESWDGANNFRYHVWWHRALFHLELEQYDEVLRLYDGHIRADQTEDVLDVSNGVAMLWRLEDNGIDVGNRWQELADIASRRAEDHVLAFADAHYIMALVADGRAKDAQRLLGTTDTVDTAITVSEAPVLKQVARPLGDAVAAYRAGDFGRAVDLLMPIRYDIQRIGGSHAQRDVFARLLIMAALKSGRGTTARALLSERTALSPKSPWSWKCLAEALAATDDAAGAAKAQDKASALLAA